MSDGSAPGWDAIDAALASKYGARAPKHYGTVLKFAMGGPDPLDGISVYTHDDGGSSHFHFVTYGLTELYEKETSSPEWSGFGFELTFRLARAPGDDEPPVWVMSFLQNLARYVVQSGNIFEPGHYVDLNGPIALGQDTRIRAIAFERDPELPPRDTPNGRVEFLQIVGLTLDELAAARRWKTEGVLSLLRGRAPLLVTDLARASLLTDPANVAAVEQGALRDGSSCGSLFGNDVAWRIDSGALEITLGATLVRDLVSVLPGRVGFGQSFLVAAAKGRVVFEPGGDFGFGERDGAMHVRLPKAAAFELAKTLAPKRGVYTAAGGALRVVVTPSLIRDREGRVVETVG
jgi:hypothetical protein